MSIQTQKLRSVIWPLLNPDTGFMYCHSVRPDPDGSCSSGEIRRILHDAMAIRRQVFLSFASLEGRNREQEIRALGEAFGNDPRICGIEIVAGTENPEETRHMASVCRKAFPHTSLFLPAGMEAENTEDIGYLLEPNEILDYEPLAKKHCLALRVDPDDAQLVCFAAIHRVGLLLCGDEKKANRPCHAGHRFRILEVVMDDTEKDRGVVRFSLTADNAGTVPCYGDARFMLRLCGSGTDDERVFPLPLMASDLPPGHEKTVRLDADVSGLSSGEYDVQIGLFFSGTGDGCSFGIEGRISDGYYEGRIILDLQS